ncbi:MAG TPA: hypothetical protein VMY42_26390 [Thermoguttaceae bacterium]|nr:hypothetical protein [Thermoguttaceae bacterium]
MRELENLLEAAGRQPGEWFARSFPFDLTERLVERAKHSGFEVQPVPHGTAPGILITIRVRDIHGGG